MKQCFGAIYPDLSSVGLNKTLAGRVFKVRYNSFGVMPQAPTIECDMARWEECQDCELYRSCFDLSNAKLAIHQAVRRIL
jgi:hypothetical protein